MKHQCWNKFDTEFIQTEMKFNISWNSRIATDILFEMMNLLGTPYTLNLNQNGLAHYIKYNIKDRVLYDNPIIWSEVYVKDEYIFDEENKVNNINSLYCYYYIKLNNDQIDRIGKLLNYNIWYEIKKNFICINTNNFDDAHLLLKICLDIINKNTIDISKFNIYFRNIKHKYLESDKMNLLIPKILELK